MTSIELDSATLDEPPDTPDPERTRKPRSDKGVPRGTGGRKTRASTARKLADDLLVPYATLAAGIAIPAPTLSAVMMTRGEKTVDAIVSIAGKHPRMMKALQTASELAPMAELFQTGFMMLLAAGLDFGRIPPEHPLAMTTGLSDLYMQTHPPVEENSVNGQPMSMPPNMVPFPGMPG